MCRNVFVGCLCSAHNVEPSCTSRNSNIRQMLQETFISVFFSPHVREFEAVLDSGFHAMDSEFHSLLAQDYGFHRQNVPVFLYMGGVITLGNVSCNFLANLQQIERRSRYLTLHRSCPISFNLANVGEIFFGTVSVVIHV